MWWIFRTIELNMISLSLGGVLLIVLILSVFLLFWFDTHVDPEDVCIDASECWLSTYMYGGNDYDKDKMQNALISLNEGLQSGDSNKVQESMAYVYPFWNKYVNGYWYKLYSLFSIYHIWYLLMIVGIVAIGKFCVVAQSSMRPTLLQGDTLCFSTMDFSVKVPLIGKVFLKEEDILHGNILVFEGNKYVNKSLFGLQQKWAPESSSISIVKRCIAKGGEKVFFYGGLPYVLNKQRKIDWGFVDFCRENKLVYSPLISHSIDDYKVYIKYVNGTHRVKQYLLFGEPICEFSYNNISHQADISCNMDDVWGGEAIGSSHMMYVKDVESLEEVLPVWICDRVATDSNSVLLKIMHHPVVKGQKISGSLKSEVEISYLLLDEDLLKCLFQNMSTDRFIVKSGKLYMWTDSLVKHVKIYHNRKCLCSKGFEDVPDGEYDLINGKFYQYKFFKQRAQVEDDHPINKYNVDKVMGLFNFCVNSINEVHPLNKFCKAVYFRTGSLYVDRVQLLKKDDPRLNLFLEYEYQLSLLDSYYKPFIDQYGDVFSTASDSQGDGDIIRLIESKGIQVKDQHVLLLGDNYAGSVDSRQDGLFPMDCLEGTVVYKLLPFSSMPFNALITWGFKATESRVIVIIMLLIIGIICKSIITLYRKYKTQTLNRLLEELHSI